MFSVAHLAHHKFTVFYQSPTHICHCSAVPPMSLATAMVLPHSATERYVFENAMQDMQYLLDQQSPMFHAHCLKN